LVASNAKFLHSQQIRMRQQRGTCYRKRESVAIGIQTEF
jgi:hypothetical protein